MGRKKSTAEKQEKKTPTRLAPITEGTEPWKVLKSVIRDMVAENATRFGHLKDCAIRLWWAKDWKVDADNICVGAMCCKASELDRLLAEEGAGESPAIFIKLPKVNWPRLDQAEKEFRLYHELCHIRPALTSDGKQKRDSKDRLLWRTGKHPIVAFHEEIAKWGVERVLGHNGSVVRQIQDADRPLLAAMEKGDGDDQPAADDPTKPDAWKRWGIAKLDLTPAAEEFMVDCGFKTLGKLSEAMNAEPGRWDQGMKANTARKPPNFRERVEENFREFWAAHPEFAT
jgi:hypothetical protein